MDVVFLDKYIGNYEEKKQKIRKKISIFSVTFVCKGINKLKKIVQ